MTEVENYRNEIIIDNNIKIKRLDKENKWQDTINIFIGSLVIILVLACMIQNERLNEHKRLLIAQQTQINQLILNAKQNELNRK